MYKYILSFLVFFSLASQDLSFECPSNEISGKHVYFTERDDKSCILCGQSTGVFLPEAYVFDCIEDRSDTREHERGADEVVDLPGVDFDEIQIFIDYENIFSRPEVKKFLKKRSVSKRKSIKGFEKNSENGRYYCPYENCRKNYKCNGSLRYHVDTNHLREERYTCKFCNEKFVYRHKRDMHIRKNH